MDLASPTSGLPKGRGVLMGGGTFSCMIPSMVTGRAMLRYLEEHEESVYPALEEKGQLLREGIEKAFRSREVVAHCFGVGSLLTTCFPPSREISLRNIEEVETRTDIVRRDREFRLRMLNHGVYTRYGGGAVSTAHSSEDLRRVIQAAENVAGEMAEQKA